MARAEVQSQGGFAPCASNRMLGKNAACKGESRKTQPRCLSKEPQPQADTTSIIGPQDTRSNSPLSCPECGSQKLFKAGFRYLPEGTAIQRLLCPRCCVRFSQSTEKGPQGPTQPLQKTSDVSQHVSIVASKSLKAELATLVPCRVGASGKEAKNLEEEARQEQAQREGTPQTAVDAKGKILEYAWWLKKKGRSEETIKSRVRRLKGLAKLCNLMDSEAVKEALAKLPHKNSTKAITTSVYTNFLKCFGLKWEPPEYKMEQSIPFIPLESEIDQLIASCSKRTATLLQLLKETGARIGEAAKMTWIDFDSERRTVRIQAEKGSNPRMFCISEKLAGMLNALPKRSDYIFNRNTGLLRNGFDCQRARATAKLNNPRLKRITFHTLRHWKGTMEYHKTKDPWHVKRILGHKTLKSTEVYINIEQAMFLVTDDEYHVKVANDLKEACQLVEVGFEYITDMEGAKIFRKRK